MVKLYTSLVSFTLTASLALAVPHPSYNNGFDDLAAREPSFFGDVGNFFKHAGRAVEKGINVVKEVADNPFVQTALSFVPGGAGIMAGVKTIGTIKDTINKAKQVEGVVRGTIGKAITTITTAKNLASNKKVQTAIIRGKQGQNIATKFNSARPKVQVQRFRQKVQQQFRQRRQNRRHRRDLEDYEEQSSRDLDDEELFGREYDDILAERDFFDDLD